MAPSIATAPPVSARRKLRSGPATRRHSVSPPKSEPVQCLGQAVRSLRPTSNHQVGPGARYSATSERPSRGRGDGRSDGWRSFGPVGLRDLAWERRGREVRRVAASHEAGRHRLRDLDGHPQEDHLESVSVMDSNPGRAAHDVSGATMETKRTPAVPRPSTLRCRSVSGSHRMPRRAKTGSIAGPGVHAGSPDPLSCTGHPRP